jgi:hypothetical protein
MDDLSLHVDPLASMEIERHITEQRKKGHMITLQTKDYRNIAAVLGKVHQISFNMKECKKKNDVIRWLDRNWSMLREPFFLAMDNLSKPNKGLDSSQ